MDKNIYKVPTPNVSPKHIIIRGFLERQSTAQGGSTGRFTITLTIDTDGHTYTNLRVGQGDRHGCGKQFRYCY